jgi:UPF0288 family protein (methanogenesis marker protein 3)
MWTWSLDGVVEDPYLLADLTEGWPTMEEAESWLREMFADLADEGISEVTLLCDAEPIYTMSLLGG